MSGTVGLGGAGLAVPDGATARPLPAGAGEGVVVSGEGWSVAASLSTARVTPPAAPEIARRRPSPAPCATRRAERNSGSPARVLLRPLFCHTWRTGVEPDGSRPFLKGVCPSSKRRRLARIPVTIPKSKTELD